MKTMQKYILIGLVMILAACQNKDDYQYDKVQVYAGINEEASTRVSDDGACFTNGDVIKVINTSRGTNNIAAYKYSESGREWTSEDLLLWEGYGENVFKAWYPSTASFERFAVPVDQSSGMGMADWMTAVSRAKLTDGGVGLLFGRHLAKIRIEIASWGSEFTQQEQSVSSVEILSLSSSLNNDGSSVSGNGEACFVKTCPVVVNKVYSALVAPGIYASGTEIMQIDVKGVKLSVKTSDPVTVQDGKAYTFKVNVGKNLISLTEGDVAVSDWTEEGLGDQIFEDVLFQLEEGTPLKYDMDFAGGEIGIKLSCNTDFNVSVVYTGSQQGWITIDPLPEGNSLPLDMSFKVDANSGSQDRAAKIVLSSPYYNTPIELSVSQTTFKGIDESSFSPDKYLIYKRNYHSYWDGDDLTVDATYFECPVSFEKITFKFQFASTPSDNAYISLGSTNTARDNYINLSVNSKGIDFKDINEDDPSCHATYTWSEMGVSSTDVLTITLNATDQSVTVNGMKLSGFAVRGLSQLFSDYFRESDDGVYTDHDGFVQDSKLFYVKMWDKQNRLIYLGSAAKAYNTRTKATEACWVSTYYVNGRIYTSNEFAHYCQRAQSYTPFGTGNL